VVNKSGLEAIDEKVIRVRYNSPLVVVSNAVLEPRVDEETTVTVDINDVDSRVTGTKYFMDGVEVSGLTFSWSEIAEHTFRTEVSWNDGFEDFVIVRELVIRMTAADIQVGLEYSNSGSTYTMVATVVLGDADLDHLQYEIKYRVPFSNEAVLCYNSVGNASEEFEFANSGVYTVTVHAYDELNTSGSDTVEVDVQCVVSGNTVGSVNYIEWE
jgi:hypothetical protein